MLSADRAEEFVQHFCILPDSSAGFHDMSQFVTRKGRGGNERRDERGNGKERNLNG